MDNHIIIKETKKITYIGAIINLLLAFFKIIFGYLAHSQALIADGVHSFSDLLTDAAIIIGAKYWSAAPDKDHPYGHGRIETIINILIGLLLLSVGLGIGWNALKSIGVAHDVPPGWSAFAIALASIILKEFIFRWTEKVGKKLNSRAIIANAWHHRSDALSSVPVAASVIGAKLFPQLQYLDHIAAFLVTAMIIKAAFEIVWPSISEITEAIPDKEIEIRIKKYQQSFQDIREIHRIRSRRIGSSILVDLHMLVDPKMNVESAHIIAEEFSSLLKDKEKDFNDIIIHIEPFNPHESLVE